MGVHIRFLKFFIITVLSLTSQGLLALTPQHKLACVQADFRSTGGLCGMLGPGSISCVFGMTHSSQVVTEFLGSVFLSDLHDQADGMCGVVACAFY